MCCSVPWTVWSNSDWAIGILWPVSDSQCSPSVFRKKFCCLLQITTLLLRNSFCLLLSLSRHWMLNHGSPIYHASELPIVNWGLSDLSRHKFGHTEQYWIIKWKWEYKIGLRRSWMWQSILPYNIWTVFSKCILYVKHLNCKGKFKYYANFTLNYI